MGLTFIIFYDIILTLLIMKVIMKDRANIPQRVRETLGENIRRERVIRNMTQAELAREIGTSQMMVSNFEKGKYSPSVWRCYRIAKVFDTTVERLLTEKSNLL